jgi:DNA-binding CsgD family transcriptional regulator
MVTKPQVGEPITPGEADLLRGAANGKTDAAMARDLQLTQAGINSRWKSIFCKLDVSSRTHAVALTIRLGIVRPDHVDTSRYLAAVRQRSLRAETALKTVRALHRPSGDPGRQICPTCSRPGLLTPWPCPTANALNAAA